MFGLSKMDFKSLIPNWKPLTVFFLVITGGKMAARRAGIEAQTATSLIVLALGAFLKVFKVKLKFLGNVQDLLYELGIAMTANEFMRKTVTLKNITGMYKAIVFGTSNTVTKTTGSAIGLPKMTEG